MTDLVELLRIAVAIALVAAPPILIVRLIAGPDGPSLPDLLAFTIEQPRPHGVQEEDAPRWQVERVRPRRGQPSDSTCVGRRNDRPVQVRGAAS
jgi:hypothetical protein